MIPKILHQTCKNKKDFDKSKIWQECHNKFIDMYQKQEGFTIKIYDNEDIYSIVEQYFPEDIGTVKEIKIGAVLADIFRYLILYLEGGIYADMDCEPLKNITSILDTFSTSDMILSTTEVQVCQWFIVCKPNLSIFKELYKEALNNTKDREFITAHSVIHSTGPGFFGKKIKQSNIYNITYLKQHSYTNDIIKHHGTKSWDNFTKKRIKIKIK